MDAPTFDPEPREDDPFADTPTIDRHVLRTLYRRVGPDFQVDRVVVLDTITDRVVYDAQKAQDAREWMEAHS